MAGRMRILPPTLIPFGVSREQAAALIGVGATLFDRLVHDGRMPEARVIDGRLVWDVSEIEQAFRALPHRSEPVGPLDGTGKGVNPWD
ncbi:helix-turn-helix transcriptional regulator [Mesorhizobium sp. 128a]